MRVRMGLSNVLRCSCGYIDCIQCSRDRRWGDYTGVLACHAGSRLLKQVRCR